MNEQPVILIVDDATTNIQVLASYLKDDYHLKIATKGERCLTLAETSPIPDLILLDINMPDLNGYEVCKRLKQNNNTKSIPVIFITSMTADEDEKFGLQLGAVDYITKPIRPDIVKARIKTHIQLKQQNDILREMALRDQLTGLYNRHYLDDVADRTIAQATRHQTPLCLLMIDVDHFKNINDQYGHQTGDEVLKAIAHILMEQNRKEDIVARFGGEEFIILLSNCSAKNAKEKAEKIRKQVENIKINNMEITISIGGSLLNETTSNFDSLVTQADSQLYQAKALGRNQVMFII